MIWFLFLMCLRVLVLTMNLFLVFFSGMVIFWLILKLVVYVVEVFLICSC